MILAFNDRMWLMGGWYNGRLPSHEASREVWSSSDGATWDRVTASAGWCPRIAAGAVVFQGRMWILGGTEDYYFGDETSLKNDVWSSADGKNWTQETPSAPWSPRAYHAAVVHDGKLWVRSAARSGRSRSRGTGSKTESGPDETNAQPGPHRIHDPTYRGL
jgi:hypothetical protein